MTKAEAAPAAPRHTLRQRYPWLLPGALLLLLTLLTINAVVAGPLLRLDRQVRKFVRVTGNSADWRWVRDGSASPARLLVDLGNARVAIPVLIVIAAVVAARRRTVRPLLTAATGTVLLLGIITPAKILIGRLASVYGYVPRHALLGSFPSGHAATACVCSFLAVLVVAPRPRGRGRRIALRVAAVVGLLVGAAAVWCEMHRLTDVVAGWALAALIVPLTLWLIRPKGRPGRAPGEQRAEPRPLAVSTDPGAG